MALKKSRNEGKITMSLKTVIKKIERKCRVAKVAIDKRNTIENKNVVIRKIIPWESYKIGSEE